MSWTKRRFERTTFGKAQPARVLALDGSWQLRCIMLDISASGARLQVEDAFDGVDFKEFYLVLSANGMVRRRCELVRVTGQEIGVRFAEDKQVKRRA